MKDSLWSIDLFRRGSVLLKSHWVLVLMDQFTHRLIGFGVHAGDVDGVALCRLFNRIISGRDPPPHLRSDHDPLFRYFRWQANLRILDIDPIKNVPDTPVSHPFVERLIGTVRREFVDQTLFWNAVDLEKKLGVFQEYYDHSRVHASLEGDTPEQVSGESETDLADLEHCRWQTRCHELVQFPVAA